MLKTLEQINREFIDELKAQPARTSGSVSEYPAIINILPEKSLPARKIQKDFLKYLSDVIFYAAIASILITALTFSVKSHGGFRPFGYSWFTVLSGSMQREIPKGSLVISKKVEPNTIKEDDDIVYIKSDNETVTHRVIDIIENYDGLGARGFITKGLENPAPDDKTVHEADVIGVVKFNIPELGFALSYIADNISYVLLLLGGIAMTAVAANTLTNKKKIKKHRKAKIKNII